MLEYYRFKVINDLFMKGQTEEACIQLKELQKRYVDLCEENSALKAQVREFEDILFLARNFIFDGSFYWLITGSIKQGPFCPSCYNRDGQLVRIADMRPKRCPSCGEMFEVPRGVMKQRMEGNIARALDQSAAVGSLRSFAALEQMAQAQMVQAQLEQESLAAEGAPKPKAKIIPFKAS